MGGMIDEKDVPSTWTLVYLHLKGDSPLRKLNIGTVMNILEFSVIVEINLEEWLVCNSV